MASYQQAALSVVACSTVWSLSDVGGGAHRCGEAWAACLGRIWAVFLFDAWSQEVPLSGAFAERERSIQPWMTDF
ncbi:hypothetical protein [Acidovorax sp. SUPP3334]|uniref:hypothetical protein n=1 Tax=Acidovorax sp. SUPP3334 TaxID=2920881 RepID=UPI0023DE55DF|nr:hypothetical protein [Acidovorax sp. SUPP3334]GKT23556.1 hypothetical protein AVHM3334_11995 [Acidovorax sp. SUPP3334]